MKFMGVFTVESHRPLQNITETKQHVGDYFSSRNERGSELYRGAGRSSEVERSLMVQWVVGSILRAENTLSYFSFQPVLHNWCNKGRGMCYPVCGMVHIKEPLLLIGKSSLCGTAGLLSHYQNGP